MNAHLTAEVLDRLHRRALSGPEVEAALRHIGECEACAARADADVDGDVDAVSRNLAGNEESWHVDPETELAQYVDGTLGAAEREIVDSHLDDCAMCRREVADLMAFAKPQPRRRAPLFGIAAAAAAIVVAIVLIPRDIEPPPQRSDPPAATASIASVPNPTPVLYANADWNALVREAVKSRRLPFPDLSSIEGASDVLRGSSNRTVLSMKPAGVVVDEVRPGFSWPARESATYVVTVFEDEEEVAQSEPLAVTRWRPATALKRGATYVWQVAVFSNGKTSIVPAPPAPPAMFRVVSQRDHDDLAEGRRVHPDDHLLHAVLAARAGLRAEALDALGRAQTEGRWQP